MNINATSWAHGMRKLAKVRRHDELRARAGLRTHSNMYDLHKPLSLSGPERWQTGSGWAGDGCEVYDAEGRDLCKLYGVVWADDSSPQWPDGVPGVVALHVDEDGAPLERRRSPGPGGMWKDRASSEKKPSVGLFLFPGLKIFCQPYWDRPDPLLG